MKRLLVLLFISILTAGCGGVSNFDVASGQRGEDIANSEMAYVLVKAVGGGNSHWRHTDTAYSAPWDKREMLAIEPPAGWSALINNEKFFFVQLKPGAYTMVNFGQLIGNTAYSMNINAKQQNEALKHKGGLFGSFNVEKGKINYLGDITVYPQNRRIELRVKDNQASALEYLQKKHPKINPAGLFTVKLIKPKQ